MWRRRGGGVARVGAGFAGASVLGAGGGPGSSTAAVPSVAQIETGEPPSGADPTSNGPTRNAPTSARPVITARVNRIQGNVAIHPD